MIIFKIVYHFLSNKNVFQILSNCKNLYNFLVKTTTYLFFEKKKYDKNFHIYEIQLTRCFLPYCIFNFLFFFKLYSSICINNDKILCGYKTYTKSLQFYAEKKNSKKYFFLFNFFSIKTAFFSIDDIVGNLIKINCFYFADISDVFFKCLKVILNRIWFTGLGIISHMIYYEKKTKRKNYFSQKNSFKLYFTLISFFPKFVINKKITKEFLRKFNPK
ncbi:hypothetical protein CPARA_1gp056 (nucleomorph) [Cryptomonas paramecium]|uniref:Uncharacterized protein n=1 Tax=Cryptomonas paramaecium TaxID=2898 RepID=F2HHB8_9CRYP|nr:hypothetical protein CPARA_1gp056 [Cryptomonas paramecium]AEA38714.1 hypothetical protein CPARA_1gp056 [Cryptomonas paramecium]|mmetsp:Transcript_53480/g.141834  ORF Transcript_53480/g.141834 Transcript_53480/m.141834 type:complete len:217 (+) Transcript_53480:23032-23682(+)